MTRIATIAAHQSAIADIMRAQRELNIAHRQFTSGKIADDLKGFGAQSELLVATRAVLNREAGYIEAAKRVTARLEVQGLAISQFSETASELRQSMLDAVAMNKGGTLMAHVEDLAARAAAALNTKFAGKYIFSGGREDAAPFGAGNLAEIAAAPSAASLFSNGDILAVVRLDDGAPHETGILADELGVQLMEAFKRIKDFADAQGGQFSEDMTGAERDFLVAEMANIVVAFDAIAVVEARNGLNHNRIEAAADRAVQRRDTLEILMSDLEDADMAAVVARMEQARTALDASAAAFSMLSRTSLLDFLR